MSQYHEDLDDCWVELEDMVVKDMNEYEDLRYTPEEYAQIQKEWNEYEDNRKRKGFNGLKGLNCIWARREESRIKELMEEKEDT